MINNRHLRDNIYWIGHTSHQLFGCKLPSNKEVLKVLFYNLREVKLSVRDSARLVIDEVLKCLQNVRISTQEVRHCIPKLEALYNEWRNLQKKKVTRRSDAQMKKEYKYIDHFDNLFDITHSNVMDMINNNVNK